MYKAEQKMAGIRQELLKNVTGHVLEVGSGTGVNFQFYNENISLLAVEPSKPMLEKAKAKIPPNLNVELINYDINDPKLSEKIPPKSVDAIVTTLVLCTINDPKKALEKFSKWLKPGGHLIVLEHVHSENKINAKFQNFFNPAWKIIGEGCNLNRDTKNTIEKTGFTPLKVRSKIMGIRWLIGIYQISA